LPWSCQRKFGHLHTPGLHTASGEPAADETSRAKRHPHLARYLCRLAFTDDINVYNGLRNRLETVDVVVAYPTFCTVGRNASRPTLQNTARSREHLSDADADAAFGIPDGIVTARTSTA
jgi:hypothetical protein